MPLNRLTETEERLAQPDQGVLMPLVENERTVERLARPCVLLPGETGVAHPHGE